jgi:mercuric ion transport protein
LQSAIVQIEGGGGKENQGQNSLILLRLFWLSGERRERIEPYVREVEWVDGRPVISGFGQVLKSGLFGRDAMVDMKDRNLVAAGVVAGLAAICCATPVVVAAIGAAGLTAWLAKAGNVLVPALILCAGLIGFGLYRKQRRER